VKIKLYTFVTSVPSWNKWSGTG